MKKQKLRKTEKNTQKGITLIALVITIIVLLILAGVTISQITGESSIMGKAQQAVNANKAAEEEEKVHMAVINTIAESTTGTVSNANNLLKNKLEAMGLDVTTFGASANNSWKIQGSTGQWYQIFTNGQVTKPSEEPSDSTVALTGITINNNPASASILVGGTVQINATPVPNNTTDTLTYSSSDSNVASVSNTGLVTGVAASSTPVTITVAGREATGVTATFTVTVSSPAPVVTSASATRTVSENTNLSSTYDWPKLSQIAKAISNSNAVSESTAEVEITEGTNTPYKIGVGDEATVYFGTTAKQVRIIGFHHDTLANGASSYGTGHTGTKAGITFEFKDILEKRAINPSTRTNVGGWGSTPIKTDLNGSGYRGNLYQGASQTGAMYNATIASSIIKTVTKTYNTGNTGDTNSTSNDDIWLLACSEVWSDGYNGSGTYGYCNTSEGAQYKWYALKTSGTPYSSNNSNIVKQFSGSNDCWWLRSPFYADTNSFCNVDGFGACNFGSAKNASSYGVSPGFAI